jgi:micrococcal nuclease
MQSYNPEAIMSQNKRQTALLFSILVLLILIGLQLLQHQTGLITRQHQPLYPVERVVDGDTIVVKSIGKVRYIGINTPEIHHPTKGVEYFGQEAYAANQRLVAGKQVRLEYDVQTKDKYGRTLAYVYAGSTFINAKLLEDGYAQVMTIPPNVKHADYFRTLQHQAKTEGRGLWGNRTESVKRTTATNNQANSPIVYWANIKSKKFHRPDCQWARQIRPDNLRKSNNHQQLIKDGYQPCKACRP